MFPIVCIIRKWSHDNNWAIKLTNNIHCLPLIFLCLNNCNSTKFANNTVFSIDINIRNISVFVQVFNREIFPFSIVNLEAPFRCSITTRFSTINLKNMVTIYKCSTEIKFSGLTIIPYVVLFLFHVDAIEHWETSFSEISWEFKAVLCVVNTCWENCTEIVPDISLITST